MGRAKIQTRVHARDDDTLSPSGTQLLYANFAVGVIESVRLFYIDRDSSV